MDVIPFTQEFVLALALDWAPPEEVCREHGVSEEDYRRLLEYKPFQTALAEMRKVLSEQGVTVAFKAKVAIESLVPDIYALAADESVNPQIRLAAFQHLVKISGLDKPDHQMNEGFTLQILMSGDGPKQVVNVSVSNPLPENDVFEVPSEESLPA